MTDKRKGPDGKHEPVEGKETIWGMPSEGYVTSTSENGPQGDTSAAEARRKEELAAAERIAALIETIDEGGVNDTNTAEKPEVKPALDPEERRRIQELLRDRLLHLDGIRVPEGTDLLGDGELDPNHEPLSWALERQRKAEEAKPLYDITPLSSEETMDVQAIAANVATKRKFSAPALLKGNKTATKYDAKVANFSTWTSIEELESGRKIFVIYDYPTSGIHRALDGLMKWGAGNKMSKANKANWASTFVERSNIPVLWTDNKSTVVLPYIPNVNLYDVFANNNEIDDWGDCEWAEDVDVEQKLEMTGEVIREIKKTHETGRTWGETILPNMIRSTKGETIICDPETTYGKNVPLVEQKARDLKDIAMSICGALSKADKFDDFKRVVDLIAEEYGDDEVITYLREQLSGNMTLRENLFFAYTTERLGIKKPDYQKVLKALRTMGIPRILLKDMNV